MVARQDSAGLVVLEELNYPAELKALRELSV